MKHVFEDGNWLKLSSLLICILVYAPLSLFKNLNPPNGILPDPVTNYKNKVLFFSFFI